MGQAGKLTEQGTFCKLVIDPSGYVRAEDEANRLIAVTLVVALAISGCILLEGCGEDRGIEQHYHDCSCLRDPWFSVYEAVLTWRTRKDARKDVHWLFTVLAPCYKY